MATPTSSTVGTRREGAVWTITLGRPHKRNAVDRAMADALDTALNTLDDDPDLRVGILSGGPDFFCAGSDLASRGDYVTARGGEYGIIRRHRRKPLIAAVEGQALGGGLEIVLACDMVVAASNAWLGLPEVQRGVLPTCGALFRALQALPPHIARELVLAGQPMNAARAHVLGLVNHLAEPGHAMAVAQTLAAQVAANAPLSVQACLGAMNGLLAVADAAGWQATEEALARIRGSDDLQEGLCAFFDKRAPVWSGR